MFFYENEQSQIVRCMRKMLADRKRQFRRLMRSNVREAFRYQGNVWEAEDVIADLETITGYRIASNSRARLRAAEINARIEREQMISRLRKEAANG